MRLLPSLAALLLALPSLQAGDLAMDTAAKLVQMVSRGSSEAGKVACKDEAMAGALRAVGAEVNPGSRIAWASSENEVRTLSLIGKLVVARDPKFINAGAGLVITEEGGRPRMMVNPKAIQKSGVRLSDAVLKAAVGA